MREPDRIIRLKTVLSRTGLSRSTIYRKIAEGTFPAQLKISTNGTGWHESDINRWIADPVSWRPKMRQVYFLFDRHPGRLGRQPGISLTDLIDHLRKMQRGRAEPLLLPVGARCSR